MPRGDASRLKVFTSEEAAKNGRLGGMKSAVVRRRAKTFAEGLKMFLKQKDEEGVPYANRIHLAMLEKALCGDVKATEYLRDTIGEKPGTNVSHTGGVTMEVRWMTPDEESPYD